MKKAVIRVALTTAAVATMCLTGCFSVDTAKLGHGGGEHVVMSNYGWKLFNWIPLFCGNASEDASCGFVLFRNDVTAEKVQARFAKYANGRTIECPVYDFNDTVFFELFGFPIPYILTYSDISLSGTMK